MSKIKLKPCPFCGRPDKLIIHEVSQRLGDTDIKQYTVVCNTSGDNAGCGAKSGRVKIKWTVIFTYWDIQ